MTARPRVLFVSHQATRTGAPRVLLGFLRWLDRHADIDAEVLLWRDGPLAHEFRALAPVHVAGRLDRGSRVELLERNLPVVGLAGVARGLRRARLRPRLRRLEGFDLCWLNCAESAHALPHLPTSGRVVAHVHELEMAIRFALPDPIDRERWLRRTDHVVAVSGRVRDNLVDEHGVDPSAVSVHYEFVDPDDLGPPVEGGAVLRRRLGIPPDAVVVGAAGTQEWRKGTDLFLQLAVALERRRPGRTHLVWIGAGPAALERAQIRRDLHAAGLAARVHFPGEQERPADWYDLFDLLILPSREDPFPLVCLEAGLVGLPVVAFDCGGMTELLDGENGVVVPPLDVEAMADVVADLVDAPERRVALGRRLGADVRARHIADAVAPGLHDLLLRLCSGAPRSSD